VIASGDVTSREVAERVLAETGAAAVMVGRAAQGNPWLLRDLAGADDDEPSADEVVAELLRFMGEVAREMGPERSVGFLRKFYGWYLHGGRLPKPVKAALGTAPTLEAAEDVLVTAAPSAAALVDEVRRDVAALPSIEDDRLLGLPISIYGGG
jgi:tRNA-dihydrouridine synthase B